MAVLHVRNIPDKVYKQAQAIAARRGVSLSTHILELLEADIAADAARVRHRRIMTELRSRPYHVPVSDTPTTSDIIHELRDERDNELS